MVYILSGTNRPNSRTRQVAGEVLKMYQALTKDVEILDLAELPYAELTGQQYGVDPSPKFKSAIDKVNSAEGIVIVTPEYNGSMPGALKYFIDHWSYPKSFEYRPVAFVGLGFRFGGLRPVEHLQQVFGYRNAYVFPERVFIMNITDALKDGKIVDKTTRELLEKQTKGFLRFIKALKAEKLHPSNLSL